MLVLLLHHLRLDGPDGEKAPASNRVVQFFALFGCGRCWYSNIPSTPILYVHALIRQEGTMLRFIPISDPAQAAAPGPWLGKVTARSASLPAKGARRDSRGPLGGGGCRSAYKLQDFRLVSAHWHDLGAKCRSYPAQRVTPHHWMFRPSTQQSQKSVALRRGLTLTQKLRHGHAASCQNVKLVGCLSTVTWPLV